MPKKKIEETKKSKKGSESKKSPKKGKITQADFEKKVVELSKKDLTAEKIGEALKKEGIHPGEFKKKVSQILKSNDTYVDPDLKNIEDKFKRLEKHVEKNAQDKKAIREKSRVFSQLRKLKKYRGMALK